MEKETKRQIEKEIGKCQRRIEWEWNSPHYWMHRKAMLINCLNFGVEVVMGDIEKTLQRKDLLQDVLKAHQDTLLDLQTKWAK